MTRLARSRRTSVRLAQRAQIVLLAAQRLQNKNIAGQLGQTPAMQHALHACPGIVTEQGRALLSRHLGEPAAPRGVFTTVPEPVAAIDACVAHHNTHSKPFIWTRGAGAENWIVDPNRDNRSALHKQMAFHRFEVVEERLGHPVRGDLPACKGRLLVYQRPAMPLPAGVPPADDPASPPSRTAHKKGRVVQRSSLLEAPASARASPRHHPTITPPTCGRCARCASRGSARSGHRWSSSSARCGTRARGAASWP